MDTAAQLVHKAHSQMPSKQAASFARQTLCLPSASVKCAHPAPRVPRIGVLACRAAEEQPVNPEARAHRAPMAQSATWAQRVNAVQPDYNRQQMQARAKRARLGLFQWVSAANLARPDPKRTTIRSGAPPVWFWAQLFFHRQPAVHAKPARSAEPQVTTGQTVPSVHMVSTVPAHSAAKLAHQAHSPVMMPVAAMIARVAHSASAQGARRAQQVSSPTTDGPAASHVLLPAQTSFLRPLAINALSALHS